MTTTIADQQYVDEALAALDQCNSDADLMNWDDRYTSNERYLALSNEQVKRLEAAYNKRVRWVCGVGA